MTLALIIVKILPSKSRERRSQLPAQLVEGSHGSPTVVQTFQVLRVADGDGLAPLVQAPTPHRLRCGGDALHGPWLDPPPSRRGRVTIQLRGIRRNSDPKSDQCQVF